MLDYNRRPSFADRVNAAVDRTLTAEDIAGRLYVAQSDLPEGVQRIALKEVHANRCPALVEWDHLRDADFERLGIDPAVIEQRAARLRKAGPALAEKIRQVYAAAPKFPPTDVDGALYDGFIPESDKRLAAQVRATPPGKMASAGFSFRDPRMQELLFRYRARNWPGTLGFDEQARWRDYLRLRLRDEEGLGEVTLPRYRAQIEALREVHAGDEAKLDLLDQLGQWGDEREADIE